MPKTKIAKAGPSTRNLTKRRGVKSERANERLSATPTRGEHRLCKKCGATNDGDATECVSCGSSRLAPSWVLARHEITKQFDVQITTSSEQFGPSRERITLTKWWPGSGGRNPSLHINNPEQWQKIRDAVDNDFGPRM